MTAPIVLTTDFGLEDGYVGVMKGVILGINPSARILDLTHLVGPQDVAGAAFVLGTSYRYFPPGTVHVVVVDPGVGSQRRAVAVQTALATFVAPDNGVLTWVLRDHGIGERARGAAARPERTGRAPAPPGIQVVELTERRYWLPEVSGTFHGRDVFAPVAAHLSLGVTLRDLGRPATDPTLLPHVGPRRRGNDVVGHVVRVDHFGNLVTDLRPSDLPSPGPPPPELPPPELPTDERSFELEVRGATLRGLRRFYAEGEGLGVVVGSAGLLEVALTDGSAAVALGARVGDEVIVRASDSCRRRS